MEAKSTFAQGSHVALRSIINYRKKLHILQSYIVVGEL